MNKFGRDTFLEMFDEKLAEMDELFSDYEEPLDPDLSRLKELHQDMLDIVTKNMG